MRYLPPQILETIHSFLLPPPPRLSPLPTRLRYSSTLSSARPGPSTPSSFPSPSPGSRPSPLSASDLNLGPSPARTTDRPPPLWPEGQDRWIWWKKRGKAKDIPPVAQTLRSVTKKVRKLLAVEVPQFDEALSLSHQHLNYTASSQSSSSTSSSESAADISSSTSTDSSPTSESSAGSTTTRQDAFTQLLAPFLAHPSPFAGPAIRSLLNRLVSESVPPSLPTLTQILQRSLSDPPNSPSYVFTTTQTTTTNDTDTFEPGAIPLIQRFLPSLPPTLDPHLLSLIVRATIRESAPDPDTVRSMLVDCLGPEPSWGVDMWDLLISAYGPSHDFRGALKVLGVMKRTLLVSRGTRDTSRLESGRKGENVHPLIPEPGWEAAEIISRGYTTTLNIWIASRFSPSPNRLRSPRAGSELPRILANDLESLLSDLNISMNPISNPSTPFGHRGIRNSIPVSFLVAWMNAERVAGNISASASIFQRIATNPDDLFHGHGLTGPSIHSVLDPSSIPPFNPHPDPSSHLLYHVDQPALISLIKLTKLFSPFSYRSLAHHILTHPSITPSRPGVAFLIPHLTSHSSPISIKVIETLLSAVCAQPSPDLPLIALTLSCLPSTTISARTIDIVSAALVRSWRAGRVPDLFGTIGRLPGMRRARDTMINASGKGGSIHIVEWEMVSKALHEMRVQHAFSEQTGDVEAITAMDGEMEMLPLSSPLASTLPTSEVDQPYTIYPSPPPVTGQGVTFARLRPPTTNAAAPSTSHDAYTNTSTNSIDAKAQALSLPLATLLERAVTIVARREKGYFSGISRPKVFAEEMKDIKRELRLLAPIQPKRKEDEKA